MNKNIRFKNSEKIFQCPLCKGKLKLSQNSLICSNNHCFDISKFGYVNLALNQKQSKHYSKDSFENRMDILEKGYYSHILTEIVQILGKLERTTTVLGAVKSYAQIRLQALAE